LAVIAALLGAGQIEMFAQRIEQGRPRRQLELRLDPVDDQRHWNLVWHWYHIPAPLRRVRSRHLNLHMRCQRTNSDTIPIDDPSLVRGVLPLIRTSFQRARLDHQWERSEVAYALPIQCWAGPRRNHRHRRAY
jgi:hypothetical protein